MPSKDDIRIFFINHNVDSYRVHVFLSTNQKKGKKRHEELPASIEDVTDSDSQVTVNTAGGQINVCGAAAGTPISVYDIRGMVRVPQFEATNATETIEVAHGEVLLVRVGSRTFKVML